MEKNNDLSNLPYNKNENNDISDINYVSISITKSFIDDLTISHNFNSNILFLAATCITLTKYNNNTKISIFTKTDNEDWNHLIHDNKNRRISVIEYILEINEILSNPTNHDEFFNESHFNYIYQSEDVNDENTTLSVNKATNQYVIKLKYDANRYTYSYAYSFLRSIKKVLNQFGSIGISNLKIEDIKLRDEQPKPHFKLKRNPLVNELLENQARKTPDKIALRTCGENYTFAQVNEEANKIANSLIKRGIKKGSKIAFMLKRDKILITTFLGIIKAGCVVVPLDINFPQEKIDYILNNSDSKYIITEEAIEGAIKPQDLIDNENSSFPEVDLKSDDSIFLLYTSGSTGNPKGVVLSHCGISNLISCHIKNNYKRLLSISSISFDISEEDILVSLTNEKELIFANDDEIKDIILLSSLIEKTSPDFVNLTPSRLLSYVKVPEFSQAIKQFRGIGCGGEQFTKKLFESIRLYTDCDIYNGYGPLEISFTSNSKKIDNPEFISNGKPLLNYITDVRDIDGKLLPYGVMGELCIGGVGVSKGYYKLEEKTKEAFISINDIPYYKSGDYAIQLPSDEIIVKGRVDNQIKLRGQRVDPEEIEQVILKYPNIEEAVVTVHEMNSEKHLCAYFISKVQIDTDELNNYLKGILSSFMVPTFFIQVDKFPETTSGKIDRKMLPKPKLTTENEQPINDFERRIYNFCTNILNNEDFGVTDNLFKLGFTSLTLMKLNSDIFHDFNITLKHADLMNCPTIRDISELMENCTSIDDIEIIRPNNSNKYQMSSQQKKLFVIYRQNPNLTNYNLPNIFKLKKSININKLEYAINKVIEAEEILRTSFHVENGHYIQKIHKSRPIKVDLIKINEDIDEVVCRNIQPFNLAKDALIRIKVLEYKGETYIFRDMHHIIGDQITIDLFHDKVKNAYHNKAFTTSKVKYKDYAQWVKKQQAVERDYWKNKDISESGTEILTDFNRPLVQTFNGDKITCDLDKETLEKQAKDNDTTVYKLLLSQFVILLYKYTNENNIQIGTVTSGRTHPSLEDTMGMFVNALPFIQSISDEDTLKETLIKTENELSNLFSNQNYSIEQIIEDHNFSTSYYKNPLFGIVFIQNTARDFGYDLNWDESKFDLTCTIKNSLSELKIDLEYNKDLYTYDKIKELLNHYTYLIDTIGQNIDKKIKDIKILSDSQENNIIKLSDFKKSKDKEPILTTLKRQIQKNPDKIILSDECSFLSYDDFNLKTNSLANYLKDRFNVKKQDKIVLIANRSIESVLGFYSILKLNAIYVPISPLAPKGRIKHIIDGVNAKIVLTNISLDIHDVNVINLAEKSLYDYDNNDLTPICQDNLCIIHTSGTTGVPKGVLISHENVEHFLINAENSFYDKNCTIFYHTTNIGFDTSLFEILFPILNAMQLHVINEGYDFTKIPKNILNQKSIINTVPAKLAMFLTLPNFKNVMKNVCQLILAGEPLSETFVRLIRKDYNPIIYNAYGPCEATIFASIKKVTSSHSITIGKSNINTQIYILNDSKQLCPIGVPGELCIGGKQVSEGYLNNDDKTNKQFIDNPFDEGILYCTGDLAYLDVEGEINFIGRKDSQIKINGQRIEIDEINKQIELNEEINQAITVVNSKKTQLYTYIVSDNVIDTDRLLNDLAGVLLPFMVPTSIMQIESIPLNNNGKIDIKKFPKPKAAKYKYVAPTNDTEKAIVETWEKILNVKRVGINDNFYRLGGDSIKAIRIVSLLQNEGIVCNPRDMLIYKTPYLIAKNVGDKVDVSYDNMEGVFDLLPIQSYFFDQINRNDYTQEFILQSKINLDIGLLQKALDELTNLHDMLRAKFNVNDGNIIQEVLPLDTRICEVNEYEINDDFDNCISRIIRNAKDSLDVFNKLIDVSLVHYNGKSYLIFVIHHLIIDGVSWSILLDDLTYIYKNLTLNSDFNSYSCKFAPYPYKNWVEDVTELINNISAEEKQHWIEVNDLLDDSQIKGSANGFHFKVNVYYDVENLSMLSEEEYWALAIARAYKKTYNKDIIFNRESYGRDESLADIYRTVGWFTSQYPAPVNVSGNHDNISLIEDVYKLKTAFKDVNHFGLNYASLVYITDELIYKHCPVTFNFLSTEFIFESEIFKSVNYDFSLDGESDVEIYGVDFNINRADDIYYISGNYPKNTFIDDEFIEFIENIKSELKFIGNYTFKCENIVCALSEPQLEIYFNEKNYDMGNAYSTFEVVECEPNQSNDEIEDAIHALINKHPILKGRIVDNGDIPLLVCDSYPLIEICDNEDFSTLIRSFDLEKYLARFFIINKKNSKSLVYDIHHVINDATGFNIIKNDLIAAFEGNLDTCIDLGFVYASRDSFESRFEPIYESAYEFYAKHFGDINEIKSIKKDSNGHRGIVSLPMRGIRRNVEEFTQNNNMTVGIFLNSVFAYAYSQFIGSNKVCFNFVEHGRHEKYTKDSLGMFAHTTPVLVDCNFDNIKNYLNYFSDLALNSMLHNVYPFRLLAKEFNLNNIVLFEYNFNLNDVSDIGDDITVKETFKDAFSEFFCVINDLDDGFVIHINHSDMFCKDTAIRFAELYSQILEKMLNEEKLENHKIEFWHD